MKARIVTLTLCIFSFFMVEGQTNATDTLAKHAGQSITLCGIVKDIQSHDKTGSLITFESGSAKTIYTAVISNKLNKSMDYKLESMKGQNVCFAGKIKVNKGVTEIMVTRIEDLYKASPTSTK